MRSIALLVVLAALAAPAAHAAAPAKAAASKAAPAKPMVLPFIEDDYTRAVAEAKARQVPLFIEAWAPW